MDLIEAAAKPNVEFLKRITSGKPLNPDDADAYAQLYLIEAREDFEYYRCLLRPGISPRGGPKRSLGRCNNCMRI
jgi:hypothetical protein